MKIKKNISAIGVLGGSFDPPHKGHLFISIQSLKKLKLKKVIWAITKKNPLKKKALFSLTKRVKLCKKLIKKNKKIQIKFFEKSINSNASFNLVRYLKKKEKSIVFFIMGSDNLIKLHKWKNYKQFVKTCYIVVFSRKGFDQKAKKSVIMKDLKNKNIILMNKERMNISSTQLRHKLLDAS
jgi:nicotinate-nucleotide adenylyltransferase|tara:strand:- start:25 stop:567 length:543 start_codon:yes stop_codon:yes gene_type:complete